MDVLRDTAVLDLRRNNIKVLQVQLQQTRDRFQVGEVTRTDVAQAESSLATGRADYAVAQANLERQHRLVPPADRRRPEESRPGAAGRAPAAQNRGGGDRDRSRREPQHHVALHQVDAAESAVKTAEGALLPTIGVQGSVSRQVDSGGVPNYNINTASVVGMLNVPLYQGGQEYATVRQFKEKLGQTRLFADSQRINVRAGISSTWGQLQSAKAAIIAFQAAVKAAEVALNGVREEAKVGQRTTLDVLNAQQTLLNTRVQLVTAQRDRVVYSYAVLAAIGRLSADTLGLNTPAYDPGDHYERTKNRFIGLTASDGS